LEGEGGRTGLPDDAVGGEGHGVGGGTAVEGEVHCLRGVGALLEGVGEGEREEEEGEGLHGGVFGGDVVVIAWQLEELDEQCVEELNEK
jgi:hypothetical protein